MLNFLMVNIGVIFTCAKPFTYVDYTTSQLYYYSYRRFFTPLRLNLYDSFENEFVSWIGTICVNYS